MQPYRNVIRESIESGSFLYTLEYVPDVRDGTGRKGIDHLEREAVLVGRDPRIGGVNIGDRVSRLDTLDTVECGAIAAAASGKMPLLHLAGKDRNPEEAVSVLQRANSLGLSNYLLITGDRVIKPKNSGARTRYYESVIAIHEAKKMDPNCLAAAVVSPFKYREEELANQYLKMVKKLNVGANYLVTNCGWDMRKFQELIWYRDARGLDAPILANLLMPPLNWAKSINAGRLPGVHLSDDLLEIIIGESKLGKAEFERLSIRRLALQIVGLKLMGYAGVHLSGVETYDLLRHVIEVADDLGSFRIRGRTSKKPAVGCY
jgi:methylenetetrahydrofolate reductase (NADPH)